MKFIVDENLPPHLAAWLNTIGHDAVHVLDRGLIGATDATVAQIAAAEARIIVTKDSDFDAHKGAGVLRLAFGNAPTPALLAWLAPRFAECLRHFETGARLVVLSESGPEAPL